jgi:predicted phosphodiesterase
MNDLRFRSDGSFTIVQFTDLHFSQRTEKDRRTAEVMAQILDLERPDFVALTGDILSGADAKDSVGTLRFALKPVTQRNIPFSMVFGNHDDESALSRKDLVEVLKSLPNNLTEAGSADLPGVGNYVLKVQGHQNHPAGLLHFVDSHAYAPNKDDGYAWITSEQAAWHRRVCKETEALMPDGHSSVPELCFFHIPLPEYVEVWNRGNCVGHKLEEVCCSKTNSGFFTVLQEAGHVIGVFVGHDHVNDYMGELDGIRLCYGRGGSFYGYGKEGFPKGARVIRLKEGIRDFQTWIRLEDGTSEKQEIPSFKEKKSAGEKTG